MKRTALHACAAAAVGAVALGGLPGVASAGQHLPNPADFVHTIDNPYFPQKPGTTLIYTGVKDGRSARELLTVTNDRKVILGISTVVIHDRLFLDGILHEDTIDWYAQHRDGTVWYFGEATRILDDKGRVLSTEGSFEAGVDGARQGIFMPADPQVGYTHHQEFYPGHAEDQFKVLDLSSAVSVPYGTFQHALLTQETTQLEPTVLSHKYFVKGIGTVREIDVRGSDEHLELVKIVNDGV